MTQQDLVKEIKDNFANKRNSIDVGFNRARLIVPNIVRGELTGITGSADSGKSKFVMQYYVKNALESVREVGNDKELDIRIFVLSLQKSAKAWRAMLLSNMLYVDHGLSIPYKHLFSVMSGKDRKMSQDIIDKIDAYAEYFEYFDKKVSIITERKPTKIAKIIEGTMSRITQPRKYQDENGINVYGYKLDNPNMFPVVIVDAITNVAQDFDPHTKQPLDIRGSMGLLVDYLKEWCSNYSVSGFVVHPQVPDKERVESDYVGKTKEEKVEPSFDGLSTNKSIGGEYHTLISLFSPYVYNIKKHADFDVGKLKFNYIGLKIIVSDFVPRNKKLGLWFDGATGYFDELPRAKDLKGANDAFDDVAYDEIIEKYKPVKIVKDDD